MNITESLQSFFDFAFGDVTIDFLLLQILEGLLPLKSRRELRKGFSERDLDIPALTEEQYSAAMLWYPLIECLSLVTRKCEADLWPDSPPQDYAAISRPAVGRLSRRPTWRQSQVRAAAAGRESQLDLTNIHS